MEGVLEQLRQRIEEAQLSLRDAARQIGVTEPTLERHLSGGYVRSDSLAKYRLWLAGESADRAQTEHVPPRIHASPAEPTVAALNSPRRTRLPKVQRHRVVDLFCGCGGLSLGFDLLHGGESFRTVMALDVEAAMIRAFNVNHPPPANSSVAIARRVDLSDFLTEAEVLAYYLAHLAELEDDNELRDALEALPVMSLGDFRRRTAVVDHRFCAALGELRARRDFREACRSLPDTVVGQTSVTGFHEALRLPLTSTSTRIDLGAVLWSDNRDRGRLYTEPDDWPDGFESLRAQVRGRLGRLWEWELDRLRRKRTGNGRGQLSSSANRIRAFVEFLDSPSMQEVRELWLDWRSQRDALRFSIFTAPEVERALRDQYDAGRRVAVLLGGPPCQGFSRIGRGKLRSLREDQVHAHYDDETRNLSRLMRRVPPENY